MSRRLMQTFNYRTPLILRRAPKRSEKENHLMVFLKRPQIYRALDLASAGWWAHQDSNLGPRDYESPALTT